jgi:hypothetical protein
MEGAPFLHQESPKEIPEHQKALEFLHDLYLNLKFSLKNYSVIDHLRR